MPSLFSDIGEHCPACVVVSRQLSPHMKVFPKKQRKQLVLKTAVVAVGKRCGIFVTKSVRIAASSMT